MVLKRYLASVVVIFGLLGSVSLRGMIPDKKVGIKEVAKWSTHSMEILGQMFLHPCATSAVSESSPWVAKKMLENMRVGNVLEIGAGPGWTLTDWIASECGEHKVFKRFDIVEGNKRFSKILETLYPKFLYPNVHLYDEFFGAGWQPKSVDSCDQFYDVIIATLPFTRLNNDTIKEILDRALPLLKQGGVFIHIQLMGAEKVGMVKAKGKQALQTITRKVVNVLQSQGMFNLFESRKPASLGNMLEARYLEKDSVEIYREKREILNDWLKKNFTSNEYLVKRNVPPMLVGVAIKK